VILTRAHKQQHFAAFISDAKIMMYSKWSALWTKLFFCTAVIK